ncbi:MAG: diaminopimelate decarboxylase [Chloroflexi bacterium HGW-Chloroflexi-9]|nr:MAG: diaminopimelate decarboxylase [Chloroflexi bacterium HGW-Chloroflexi-9]
MDVSNIPLETIARQVGTPFYLYDGDVLRERMGEIARTAEGERVHARYAMKANSARFVLDAAREAGLWIDAVSGNEVERALRAGFAGGHEPPVVMFTADVFRDNALDAVIRHGILPNIGSPGMIRQLHEAGYHGPIALRVNPGFGHGHVQACDTGGPSSKHGIWHEDIDAVATLAKQAGFPVVALHAHVGTGPEISEFDHNMNRLVGLFADLVQRFPDARAVNLGGGIPHPYRTSAQRYDLGDYRTLLLEAASTLSEAAGHAVAMEIEPGRYPVAGMAVLVARVTDVKDTRTNEKGEGHRFVMVDAGFNDLIRPAMYGSYHEISIVGAGAGRPREPLVVAGPLCESGDVFTRDDQELLVPRSLGRPEPGDLLVLHDTGAYGAAMSSNYVSLGRAAQVAWEGGQATLISRRETLDDILRLETSEPLAV